MVAKLQNFKLQMQYIVNKLHERNLLQLNKLHDRNQTMYNYMVAPLQNFKFQMQPQEVPVSDLSLSKVTFQNILVSSELAPDIDPFQGITRVFSEPSNLDPKTSRLQTETWFSHPSFVTSNLTSPNLPLGRGQSPSEPPKTAFTSPKRHALET